MSSGLIVEVAGHQRRIASALSDMGDALHRLATGADMLERVLTAGRNDEPPPMDGAMHSVWLHGKWRWLTSKMTTEEREAAADAVQRYSDWLCAQDDEGSNVIEELRWWRE